MRKIVNLIWSVAVAAGLAGLGGCGTMRTAPTLGDARADVIAKLGPPTGVYPAPPGEELEYASGPYGQVTWMATLDGGGRLVKFEQVLNGQTFATIKIDAATKADVLRTVGRPAEHSRVQMHNYEVWSYRYKESGVWNSMMHVHFDEAGIVRMMQGGPDPMYEERRSR
jgi:hypothetical protein